MSMGVRAVEVRRVLWSLIALFVAGQVIGAAPGDDPVAGGTRMLRQPSVSATHIAFAYASNIWIVERSGGTARRVTSFQGQASHPQLSPDGRQLAFSADYAGNPDVYVVPVDGGEPARLTWHP
jgi:tricorn protease